MSDAGVEWKNYRYFDPSTVGLDFDGMIDDISGAPNGSIVVLHGEHFRHFMLWLIPAPGLTRGCCRLCTQPHRHRPHARAVEADRGLVQGEEPAALL